MSRRISADLSRRHARFLPSRPYTAGPKKSPATASRTTRRCCINPRDSNSRATDEIRPRDPASAFRGSRLVRSGVRGPRLPDPVLRRRVSTIFRSSTRSRPTSWSCLADRSACMRTTNIRSCVTSCASCASASRPSGRHWGFVSARNWSRALSARVCYPGPAKEIGWAPLTLTAEARNGPLKHLDNVPVLHWHGDTFALPKGAVRLASTAITREPGVFRRPDHARAAIPRRGQTRRLRAMADRSHAGAGDQQDAVGQRASARHKEVGRGMRRPRPAPSDGLAQGTGVSRVYLAAVLTRPMRARISSVC